MLGIKIPKEKENCFLCVNGQKIMWEEGKTIVWDDTYPHAVYNETDEQRVVLYMDVVRKSGNVILDSLSRYIVTLMSQMKSVKKEIERTEKKVKLE